MFVCLVFIFGDDKKTYKHDKIYVSNRSFTA